MFEKKIVGKYRRGENSRGKDLAGKNRQGTDQRGKDLVLLFRITLDV